MYIHVFILHITLTSYYSTLYFIIFSLNMASRTFYISICKSTLFILMSILIIALTNGNLLNQPTINGP